MGDIVRMQLHGLKEQFTPFYRSEIASEFEDEEDRRRTNTCLSMSSLGALLVSLVMIVMGALHTAPVEAGKDLEGVLTLNCSVLEYCGCPGEPMIPWYLILGGCMTIVLLVVRVVIFRYCGCKMFLITVYD